MAADTTAGHLQCFLERLRERLGPRPNQLPSGFSTTKPHSNTFPRTPHRLRTTSSFFRWCDEQCMLCS